MYTYSIIFRLGNGGKFITADFGFDTKGRGIYMITGTSQPLDLDTFQEFVSFMRNIETLNTKYSGIPIVMIKKDTYTESTFNISKKPK